MHFVKSLSHSVVVPVHVVVVVVAAAAAATLLHYYYYYCKQLTTNSTTYHCNIQSILVHRGETSGIAAADAVYRPNNNAIAVSTEDKKAVLSQR